MSEASQETVSSAASESGERYPDGWPVRPIDWLAAPMWAAAVDGSDDASGFGSLAEWQRDEFRYAARVAQEHYEPKLRAIEAERDALRAAIAAYRREHRVHEGAVSLRAEDVPAERSFLDAAVSETRDTLDAERKALFALVPEDTA